MADDGIVAPKRSGCFLIRAPFPVAPIGPGRGLRRAWFIFQAMPRRLYSSSRAFNASYSWRFVSSWLEASIACFSSDASSAVVTSGQPAGASSSIEASRLWYEKSCGVGTSLFGSGWLDVWAISVVRVSVP